MFGLKPETLPRILFLFMWFKTFLLYIFLQYTVNGFIMGNWYMHFNSYYFPLLLPALVFNSLKQLWNL